MGVKSLMTQQHVNASHVLHVHAVADICGFLARARKLVPRAFLRIRTFRMVCTLVIFAWRPIFLRNRLLGLGMAAYFPKNSTFRLRLRLLGYGGLFS